MEEGEVLVPGAGDEQDTGDVNALPGADSGAGPSDQVPPAVGEGAPVPLVPLDPHQLEIANLQLRLKVAQTEKELAEARLALIQAHR
jgi:hypothetical protein